MPPPRPKDARQWAEILERTALSRLDGDPILHDPGTIDDFVDDLGHRRAVDRHFLAAFHGLPPSPAPDHAALDLRLWSNPASPAPPGSGPLSAHDGGPLEVWTETELCALHALWRRDRARALACARWHVDETQPDNATNHPWAIHVFVLLGQELDEATVYAEGLLHACLVGMGQPDRFSALILLDAARTLRADQTF